MTQTLAQRRAAYAQRRAAGVCTKCGKRSKKLALCPACSVAQAEWRSARVARWVAAGLCRRCGRACTIPFINCAICRKHLNAGTKKTRAQMRAEGRCLTCGKKKEAKRQQRTLCKKCGHANAKRNGVFGYAD